MSQNRKLDPPARVPVPPHYVAAVLHFPPGGTQHLGALFRLGGVVVRDRAPYYCAQHRRTLRHVHVDPAVFDQLRYVLACAGIGELRQKGTPKLGIAQLVEFEMERRMAEARAATRRAYGLHYADALS